MPAKIKETECCIVRKKKMNEVIKALNPLLQIELTEGEELSVTYSDNNVVLTIPSYEYEELELDVCISGSIVTKTFLVKT